MLSQKSIEADLAYFLTRSTVLTVASAGESIVVPLSGIKQEHVAALADLIEKAQLNSAS